MLEQFVQIAQESNIIQQIEIIFIWKLLNADSVGLLETSNQGGNVEGDEAATKRMSYTAVLEFLPL